MAGKSKVISTKSTTFVRGGSGHMVGKQAVGTQTPGQTATMAKSTGGKFAVGGKGRMAGKQSVQTARPGTVSTTGAKAAGKTAGGHRRGDGSAGGAGFRVGDGE